MPVDCVSPSTCKMELDKLNETLQLLSNVSLSLRTSLNSDFVSRKSNDNQNNRVPPLSQTPCAVMYSELCSSYRPDKGEDVISQMQRKGIASKKGVIGP